jgi:aspartate/methionine/tyrosine aminotransferase
MGRAGLEAGGPAGYPARHAPLVSPTTALPQPARRIERVAPFLAMDVLAAAAAKERRGDSVVHMEVGQPSAPAPRAAREAARAALDPGAIGYTEALGIAPLRERIARHYKQAYGVAVSPERVVVTTGSSAGFVLAFLALFDAGQRVAITAPGYPAYRNILAALDLEAPAIPLAAADGLDHDGRRGRAAPPRKRRCTAFWR